MKVKVCGITNMADALLAAELGADAIGFIFYKNSKRYIDPKSALEISRKLPPILMKVGVFVNQDADIINDIALNSKLNMIQLHGDEEPQYIEEIKYPVLKALRIKEKPDPEDLKKYSEYNLLFDTYDPEDYGGTGRTFNWDSIPKALMSKIVLAGGVSTDNIEFIFKNISPHAIDISSSLEESPGRKKRSKMIEFFSLLNNLRK